MNIYVLRHGIAMERDEWDSKDSERPLTPEGEKQLRKSARAMKEMDLDLDLILSSPYERAKRTAEIVARELKLKKCLKFSNELKSEGNSIKLIAEVSAMKPPPKNLLLVGHEPYLSELISLLISGDEDAAIDFKKGGLCKLETDRLRPGKCAALVWLLTPKQMKRLG